MKKTLRKRILAGAAVVALLCGTAVAASTVTTKMIEANYMGIKIVVDGVEVTPKDANGKVVEPFASEGTTYLPVRAIGEALGKEVTWDGSTATVYVGEVPGQATDWMKKLPPYQVSANTKIFDGSDPKSYMTISGNKIAQGVLMSGGYKNEGYAIWNTNLQYDTMTFTIGKYKQILAFGKRFHGICITTNNSLMFPYACGAKYNINFRSNFALHNFPTHHRCRYNIAHKKTHMK